MDEQLIAHGLIIIILVIKSVGFSKARQIFNSIFAMDYGNITG